MITVLVMVAGIALLAAWVLRPLQGERVRVAASVDAHWNELVDAKHQIYRSIIDLEFDQAVGKVSAADYAVLRRQHEVDALGVLREMDQMGSTEVASVDTLESEIAAARKRLRKAGS